MSKFKIDGHHECSHPVNFGGLCGVCGTDLTRYDDAGVRKDALVSIQMSHENNMLFVSQEEAARIENETAKRLLRTRKLSLVLDLDQTVIHAAVNPEIETYKSNKRWSEHLGDVHQFQLSDGMTYQVKLRPGLSEFLKSASELFELHIYTMGTRNYAVAISQIIDPKQEIFRERILSRDESGSISQKTIQRLFPCDDSMVVVVDDRADVWHWSENLIKVRPYHFFVATGDINDPKLLASKQEELAKLSADTTKPACPSSLMDDFAASLQESQMEQDLPPPVPSEEESVSGGNDAEAAEEGNVPFLVEDKDCELTTVMNVLKEMHEIFYELFDSVGGTMDISQRAKSGMNIKTILRNIRSRVFSDCRFAFSSVITQGSDPKKSEIWKFSQLFGATCSEKVDDDITHLICGKAGTEKFRQALKLQEKNSNVWIVRPDWLFSCVHSWRRLPEYEYVLDVSGMIMQQPRIRNSKDEFGDEVKRTDSQLSFDFPDDSYLNSEELMTINAEIEDELGDLSDDDEDSDDNVVYVKENEKSNAIETRVLAQMAGGADALKSSGHERAKVGVKPADSATTTKSKRNRKTSNNSRRSSPLRSVAYSSSSSSSSSSQHSSDQEQEEGEDGYERTHHRHEKHRRKKQRVLEDSGSSSSTDGSDLDIDAVLAEFDDDDVDEL